MRPAAPRSSSSTRPPHGIRMPVSQLHRQSFVLSATGTFSSIPSKHASGLRFQVLCTPERLHNPNPFFFTRPKDIFCVSYRLSSVPASFSIRFETPWRRHFIFFLRELSYAWYAIGSEHTACGLCVVCACVTVYLYVQCDICIQPSVIIY